MKIVISITFCLFFSFTGSSQNKQLVAKLGTNFVSKTTIVNGTTLHYVQGGKGPAIILLHGFPQDWYEYYRVMPRLSKKFSVIAVDLRGIGGSLPTTGGYESPNLAKDIYELVQLLNLQQVYVASHDIGGMVAYAFVRLYPQTVRGAMILDVPLPGMAPWEESVQGLWHISFHQVPGLPESLIAGRQATYFRHNLNTKNFSDADLTHYAASYSPTAKLTTGLEMYRAFPKNGKFFEAQRDAVDVPIVWAAGDNSVFAKYGPRIVASLKRHGCTNVQGEQIKDSGHFVVNEQPEAVSEFVEKYATR